MKKIKATVSVLLALLIAVSTATFVSAAPAAKPVVKASQTVVSMGKTTQLKATYGKKNVTTSVSWKSSNTKIATVNKKGVVSTKGCGIIYITAKYKGATSSKVKITVTSTKLDKTSVKLAGSKTYKLTAKYNKKNVNPTYKSSDKFIASVDKNGKITALKKGTATITASYKGSTAKCKVTVTSTPLTINKPTSSVTIGLTYKLNAKYNGKTVTPTYKTNNKKVATVDKNGKIKAVGKGNAVITASYKGTVLTCGVTVTNKPHSHDWKPVYKTITVEVKPAYDEMVEENVYLCWDCDEEFDSYTCGTEEAAGKAWENHKKTHNHDGIKSRGMRPRHHDAVTKTEKVIDHYKCACGATKKK